MKFKIVIAAILVFTMVIFSGCSGQSPQTTQSGELVQNRPSAPVKDTIKLLYSSKDSLDPYTCVTEQNAVLSQFIFEPLLILNNNYEIEYRLAESVTVSNNVCTITIKTAKFSDGSLVTPEDVVFSFNKAKASKTTRHSNALKYAKSASVTSNKTVQIALSRNDLYFANLLTFPIIKKGSDQLKDSDNRALPPIGAGRYYFNVKDDNLLQNANYYGKHFAIKTINTVDCPDNESVRQSITAGMVDLYFTDLLDNVIPKMNGTAADVSQTRIVFLGVNPKNPQLSNSLFRQAISTAIDRKTICTNSYFSKATPALGPVPSNWKPADNLLSIQDTANVQIASDNIELAGYTEKDKNGFYKLKNGNTLKLSLLVNSANESRTAAAKLIAENAAAAGLKITVNAVSDAAYRARLKSGSYDLYLGEIRFEENMDIGGLVYLNSANALLNGGGSVNTTNTTSKKPTSSNASQNSTGDTLQKPGEITLTSLNAYKGYYNGKYTLQDLITAFTAELPVIPICFRSGLVIYSKSLGAGLTPTRTELFHGIQYTK